jgi:hypothetical protein
MYRVDGSILNVVWERVREPASDVVGGEAALMMSLARGGFVVGQRHALMDIWSIHGEIDISIQVEVENAERE